MRVARWFGLLVGGLLAGHADPADRSTAAGPLYSRYRLTLEPGERTEWLGPLGSWQAIWPAGVGDGVGRLEWPPPTELEDPAVVSRIARTLVVSPLFAHYTEPSVDGRFVDVLYPVITYDRFGSESRLQILQLLSFSGGQDQQQARSGMWTVFPFLFVRRSENPEQNYTAFWPLYGQLKNRLFRDETRFVLWPLWVQTRQRDVVTDNYLVPFVHVRRGDGLRGWQVWPLVGHERKGLTTRTNVVGEVEPVGGHVKGFLLWPFYAWGEQGLGTEERATHRMLLPFYSRQAAPERETRTYLWPFGWTTTVDRQVGYREDSVLWPVFGMARGEGKRVDRFWPLFGQARDATRTSRFVLWPLFSRRTAVMEPLRRDLTRVGLILYQSVQEVNEQTGRTRGRRGLWPLFWWRQEWDGRERFQILALLEPLLPHNPGVARLYSPLWSVWRAEKDPRTGAASGSLLWNLYRYERDGEVRKRSLLFGLVQQERRATGGRWRLFYIPLGKRLPSAGAASEESPPSL